MVFRHRLTDFLDFVWSLKTSEPGLSDFRANIGQHEAPGRYLGYWLWAQKLWWVTSVKDLTWLYFSVVLIRQQG